MDKNPDFHQTYQPEIWALTKDSIYDAIAALMLGIENTQELLIKHDIELGRTTRSNKLTAERLEREIEQMNKAIIGIQNPMNKL